MMSTMTIDEAFELIPDDYVKHVRDWYDRTNRTEPFKEVAIIMYQEKLKTDKALGRVVRSSLLMFN